MIDSEAQECIAIRSYHPPPLVLFHAKIPGGLKAFRSPAAKTIEFVLGSTEPVIGD
jgi:hypothetical protein